MARWRVFAEQSGFILLLLTVGSLLVRPADLLPALEGAPIYECLVVACLFASLPRLYRVLASLRSNPVVAFVLLLTPAVLLSHLTNGDTYEARLGAIDMLKASILLLLVVAQADSLKRFQVLLFVMAGCVSTVALLAIAQYLGLIHLSGLAGVQQRMTDAWGEPSLLYRLCGVGVFNDPNDFSLVLVGTLFICSYGLTRHRERRAWLLLTIPMAICGVALLLTHSRGGLTALIGGVAVLVSLWVGKRNTVMLACLCVPVMVLALVGRTASEDPRDPDDTFQTRLELWSSSLDVFRADPVFGLGQGKLAEEIGQVAHNSFVHAYAELGVLGGTLFFGAFYLLLRALASVTPTDGQAARLKPFVLALVAAYTVGMLSLSRCYTVPTQLILGLGTAYVVICSRDAGTILPPVGFRCFGRSALAGGAFLVVTYLFLRVMLQRGSV